VYNNMHIFEPLDRMIAVIKDVYGEVVQQTVQLPVLLHHHLRFYAVLLLYINFPNVAQEFLYIYAHSVVH